MGRDSKLINTHQKEDYRIDQVRGKPLIVSIIEVIKKLKRHDDAANGESCQKFDDWLKGLRH